MDAPAPIDVPPVCLAAGVAPGGGCSLDAVCCSSLRSGNVCRNRTCSMIGGACNTTSDCCRNTCSNGSCL
ncbi:MAG: hypothetical protein JWM10_3586 [Myxococcaceae bacterium]|nr:hypothetical protein [Myxococcaceae bacterium]